MPGSLLNNQYFMESIRGVFFSVANSRVCLTSGCGMQSCHKIWREVFYFFSALVLQSSNAGIGRLEVGCSKFRKWEAWKAYKANGGQWKFSKLFFLQTQDIFEYFWYHLIVWHGLDGLCIEEGSPGRFARCSIQAPQLKICDRTMLSQDVRTEQVERKVRVRVFTS